MASDLTSPSILPASASNADVQRTAPPTPAKQERRDDARFEDELRKSGSAAERTAPAKTQDKGDKSGAKTEKAAAEKGADAAASGASKTPLREKKSLKPLKQVADQNKGQIQGSRVVSFLSGKLERINPQDIPEIVTENEFLSTALADGDLQTFMKRPSSISSLLDALELPGELASLAEQSGVDLEEPVPVYDFLQAIGLDPQRVTSELKVLQQNLPIDGVSGYMRRALALAGKDIGTQESMSSGKPDVRAERAGGGPVPVINPQMQVSGYSAQPAGMAQVRSTGNLGPAGMVNQAGTNVGSGTPNMAAPASVQLNPLNRFAPGLGGMTMNGQAGSLQPSNTSQYSAPNLDGLGMAGGQALPGTEAVLSQLAQSAVSGGLTEQRVVKATDMVPGQLMQDPAAAASQPRMVGAASFDAFAQMGDRLRALGDVWHADGSSESMRPAGGESYVSGVGSSGIGTQAVMTPATSGLHAPAGVVPWQLRSDLLSPATGNQQSGVNELPELRIPEESQTPAPARVAGADASLLDRIMGGAMTGGASTAHGSAKEISANAALKPLMTELLVQADIAEPTTGRERRGDEGRSDDSGFGRSEQGYAEVRDFAAMLSPSRTNTGGLADRPVFGIENNSAMEMSSAERAQVVQKIIDQATLMVRDGGGVMKLDLGMADLGPMEMAVSLQDDRVDLRIITATDRVREVLLADLNKLRDALVVQNVQLGNVDVGVQGGNQQGFAAFNQNFGGGNQRFDQWQGQEFSRGMTGEVRPLAADVTARSDRMRSMFTAPQSFSTNGRIEVRV